MLTDAPATIADLAEFISASPSSFHAAAEVARRLEEAGFEAADERDTFAGTPGGHYVVRDGALIAWRIPETSAEHGFRIVGSHTDSPSFKLKPAPSTTSAGWGQAGVEVYGGPLLSSWLNRDMGLAGRLVAKDGSQHLVRTGAVMTIPQLAPHLDRSVNDNLHLDKQANLSPVLAVGECDVLQLLCDAAGLDRAELGFYDVHATATEAPAVIGARGEFFASWRLDNLSSVYAGLAALLEADECDDIQVIACFDHEEVGSSTRSGACGPFLEDVLRRIAASVGAAEEGYRRMLARSSCISADASHAVNPNYVGMHDPANHPMFNAGPVLKINGNQRYATDAVGAALWYRACEQAGVTSQEFVGNNAVPCGSTIGPLTATRLGIVTVDVGVPLLSMHSARELCGVDDEALLGRALRAYLAGA